MKAWKKLTGQAAVEVPKGPDPKKYVLVDHPGGCPRLDDDKGCAAYAQAEGKEKGGCAYGKLWGNNTCGAYRKKKRYALRTLATPGKPYHFTVDDPSKVDFDRICKEAGGMCVVQLKGEGQLKYIMVSEEILNAPTGNLRLHRQTVCSSWGLNINEHCIKNDWQIKIPYGKPYTFRIWRMDVGAEKETFTELAALRAHLNAPAPEPKKASIKVMVTPA
jgi:hypothetical protein